MGQVETERFDFDGGREVSVFVPDQPPEAIVFAGDGQLIAPWGLDIEAASLPATLVVGVHRLEDEELRLHEYSPKFDPDRFSAHERFIVQDVTTWIRSRFNLDLPGHRTAMFGVSAGGELALAMGMRHSERFGTILSASPGAGYQPPAILASPLPKTYLVGGTQEPFFLANAVRWAEALRKNGGDVKMIERDAGHDDVMWREEFPRMVEWAFG